MPSNAEVAIQVAAAVGGIAAAINSHLSKKHSKVVRLEVKTTNGRNLGQLAEKTSADLTKLNDKFDQHAASATAHAIDLDARDATIEIERVNAEKVVG